jgi:uncharacterized protein YggE
MVRIQVRSIVVAASIVIAFLVGGLAFRSQSAGAKSDVGAPVKAASANHTISVAGHSEVKVAPDMATITLGVQTEANDAQTALSNNSARMNAVIAAVKGDGVPASHIQTSDLSLYYDSQQNRYFAQHSLTVEIDDIAKVGAVLDDAVAAGANNSWGVSFGLKDPSAAHSSALQAAVTNARTHADAIATALSVNISGVGSASEATFNQPVYDYPVAKAGAPSASGSTQVQPGQLTVSADVSVVYTFG